MTNYVVDVKYNSGEVALYGPMTGKEASEFIDNITIKAKQTCVVECKVRVLNPK